MTLLAAPGTDATAIRPFHISFPDADLADMRARIKATRWPERETVADATQGPQLATMQTLAAYWLGAHDWRKCEAKLNALPNFVTEIDGLDIHFIHVRSKHANALPLIVTHGWPGSIIEQLKIIGPLTDPTAYGGSAADAFDLVIPSLPGHGFSGKPAATGWDLDRIANAWFTLMKRLGYAKFVAQGGDWGAQITQVMGAKAPPELLGIHSNMPGTVPGDISTALAQGKPAPAGLSADEQRAFGELKNVFATGVGYAQIMATRPQALYALADSPVGLAGWILNHDAYSQAEIADAFDGRPHGELTRDEVLDNITLYWLTNTAISSARLYKEYKGAYFDYFGVKVPTALSIFPGELYQAPRSWAERAFPKLAFYRTHDAGGHFAAWEQPALFSQDLRDGFRSLRT